MGVEVIPQQKFCSCLRSNSWSRVTSLRACFTFEDSCLELGLATLIWGLSGCVHFISHITLGKLCNFPHLRFLTHKMQEWEYLLALLLRKLWEGPLKHQNLFIKNYVFFLACLTFTSWHLCEGHLIILAHVYFWVLYSIPLVYLFSIMPVPD